MGRFATGWVTIALAAVTGIAGAQTPLRFHVGVDRSRILELEEPMTKVAITTPAIADVSVLSPTSLLVNGKSAGVTSLLVFGRSRPARAFDLVVQPGPLVEPGAPPPDVEAHGVQVQRGDKITVQVFVRDRARAWLELGAGRPPAEATKR
ncbi:MAG: pilus assembly protein N-terminal domain-containing protein [Candidatus Rokubacteria bacterium]|nr:pilus assembly protein N-terminal domain-containing protein [Candidatus Rokubacteria bacterium]